MTARQGTSGKTVNRMVHIDESSSDLLAKLEAVRLVCKISGCAQRYLAHDALSALLQATRRADAAHGTDYAQRFLAYLHRVQDEDLTLGIAMTDAKGDRSQRPGQQANRDVYVHIKERRPNGIVIRGTKAIVTGAPYMHEFLVMPCRTHTNADADFAVCCAVPVDAGGVTVVARPAGRPGEPAAKFSGRYGQSTGVVIFDDVFVPYARVFLDGGRVDERALTRLHAWAESAGIRRLNEALARRLLASVPPAKAFWGADPPADFVASLDPIERYTTKDGASRLRLVRSDFHADWIRHLVARDDLASLRPALAPLVQAYMQLRSNAGSGDWAQASRLACSSSSLTPSQRGQYHPA